MPRHALAVDLSTLQAVITRLETAHGGPYRTQHELWQAVAASEWGRSIGITHSIVVGRYNESQSTDRPITCLTQPARKCRPKGEATQEDTTERPTPQPPTSPATRLTKQNTISTTPTLRVRPETVQSGSTDASDPADSTQFADFDPDYFFRHFVNAGVDVRDIGDIFASESHTDDEIRAIHRAWAAICRLCGPRVSVERLRRIYGRDYTYKASIPDDVMTG